MSMSNETQTARGWELMNGSAYAAITSGRKHILCNVRVTSHHIHVSRPDCLPVGVYTTNEQYSNYLQFGYYLTLDARTIRD